MRRRSLHLKSCAITNPHGINRGKVTTEQATPVTLYRTGINTEDMLIWVRGKGKILIVIHDNPDPDSLASAMALSHLFVMKANKEATIAFSGMIGRSENICMAKELEIALTPLDLLDLDEFKVICMLDTQPGAGNNSLPTAVKVDIVIDHHPMRDESKECKWADIREDYGVTATILYEYLVLENVYISTKMATALFYAIKSETQDLGREASRPDRDAYLRLFPLTNKKLLFEIAHPKLPKEHFQTFHRAIENTKIYGKILVVNLMAVSYPEAVAEIADYLVRLEGIETVLAIGHYVDEVILSMRTTSHEINAGEMIKRLVSGIGSAGGHGMTAAGKLDNVYFDVSTLEYIEEYLTIRLLSEFSYRDIAPEKLIPS
jgi:nanoRNase/pAp phosphatase (c-di-AMP/oligoRNAs hydrolase)